MLDIKLIRENPEKIKKRLSFKEADCSKEIDRITELDGQRRELIARTEALKAEQNKVSKQIPALKKAGEDTAPIFAQMNELKENIKKIDNDLRLVEDEYNNLMLVLPNLPDEDLKPGGKENNEPIRYFGEPHTFDFEPQHMWTCAQTSAWSTMSAGQSSPGPAFGCTPVWVHAWNGRF